LLPRTNWIKLIDPFRKLLPLVVKKKPLPSSLSISSFSLSHTHTHTHFFLSLSFSSTLSLLFAQSVKGYSNYVLVLCVCVRRGVDKGTESVCVWEREREREKVSTSKQLPCFAQFHRRRQEKNWSQQIKLKETNFEHMPKFVSWKWMFKIMFFHEYERMCRIGLNFINILRTAFTRVDPKSVKRYWWLDCLFYAFELLARKSCT